MYIGNSLSLKKETRRKTTLDSSTEWSILILFSHLRLRLPSGFFSSFFSPKTLYVVLSSPMRVTFSDHFVLFCFVILIMLSRSSHNEGLKMKIQIFWDMTSCYLMRRFIMQNFSVSYYCVSRRSRHYLSILFQNMLSLLFFQKGFTPIQKRATL